MLYTLNIYNTICQLYLSKTGKNKEKEEKEIENISMTNISNRKGNLPKFCHLQQHGWT